jgi:hypothetical protein
LKKTEGDVRAREEANEEPWLRVFDISIQWALIEETGHRFFVEERQRLLKNAAEHRALFAGLWRERWWNFGRIGTSLGYVTQFSVP